MSTDRRFKFAPDFEEVRFNYVVKFWRKVKGDVTKNLRVQAMRIFSSRDEKNGKKREELSSSGILFGLKITREISEAILISIA